MKVEYSHFAMLVILLGLGYAVYLYSQGKLDMSMLGLSKEGFATHEGGDAEAEADVDGEMDKDEEEGEAGEEGFRGYGTGMQMPQVDAAATMSNPHAVGVGSFDPSPNKYAAAGSDMTGAVVSNDVASCQTQNGLNPSDLLPSPSAEAAQFTASNPPGVGSPDGRNYLDPKQTIGINTVGQSNRNPSYDLRSEPPIPACPSATPFNQSTISQTPTRKVFEIGSQLSCPSQAGNY